LWGALLFLYAALHTHACRLRARSISLGWLSSPYWAVLSLYGIIAAVSYFLLGFHHFVLAYAGSVTILVLVAWFTLVHGQIPATRWIPSRTI